MSDRFNAYEYIAVIAPGSIIVFGASLIFPELKTLFGEEGVSVGGLGVVLILSFVLGHLLQGFGNVFEKCLWAFSRGMPTDWVRKANQTLLSENQLRKLTSRLAVNHPSFDGPASVSKPAWYALTREIYAHVSAAGRAERADSFNRTYGLLRGIAVAFIISTGVACLLLNKDDSLIIAILAAASATASYRMYRFGVHYARELFVQYISL